MVSAETVEEAEEESGGDEKHVQALYRGIAGSQDRGFAGSRVRESKKKPRGPKPAGLNHTASSLRT
jgi:hypothetical protein